MRAGRVLQHSLSGPARTMALDAATKSRLDKVRSCSCFGQGSLPLSHACFEAAIANGGRPSRPVAGGAREQGGGVHEGGARGAAVRVQ